MRKFVKMAAVAAVMSVGFVASTPAQDEPKKGRPTQPGQPGRGGFGGGMMMGGGGSVYSMLATNKVLQEELKISDDQKKKLEEVSKAQMTKLQEAMKGGFNRDATDEQKKEQREKMTKLQAETKKAYNEVLNTEQAKRAQQISYQAQGLRAFSDAEVQAALKLSDEQKEKIKTVMEQYTKDSMELRGGGRGGAGGGRPSEEDQKKMADNQKKIKALGDEAKEKIASGLSDDQKKSWKEMIGAEFDVTKLQQGFGGTRQRQDS